MAVGQIEVNHTVQCCTKNLCSVLVVLGTVVVEGSNYARPTDEIQLPYFIDIT